MTSIWKGYSTGENTYPQSQNPQWPKREYSYAGQAKIEVGSESQIINREPIDNCGPHGLYNSSPHGATPCLTVWLTPTESQPRRLAAWSTLTTATGWRYRVWLSSATCRPSYNHSIGKVSRSANPALGPLVLTRYSLRMLIFISMLLTACRPVVSIHPTAPVVDTPRATAAVAPSATVLPHFTPTSPPTLAATVPPVPSATSTPPLINPLTGLVVSDSTVLNRRPLAIKIAQFPRSVRPQYGLSQADNVWEHYAEGGVTRFTAIFLSQAPDKIGNVRSARFIDATLGEAYQAMLVASGSSQGVFNRLRQTDFFNRVIAEATGYACPILCREESEAVTTNKLFTSAPQLWQLTTKLGLNGRQSLDGFAFDSQLMPGGAPATTIHIDFQIDNTVVEWRYEPATQTYARWVDTAHLPDLAPHMDAATGQQLAAANVVILYVPHVPTDDLEGENGLYFSYDIQLTGSGRAKLFRDGVMYDVTWARNEKGLPRFVDAIGQPVPFQPGQTWFEIVTPDSPMTLTGDVFYVRFKAPYLRRGPTPTPTG
jgi:Protein of unknown function (DUF3048) N-terminal domain/Protein of unknown function (DUF3048) C-terminal domain